MLSPRAPSDKIRLSWPGNGGRLTAHRRLVSRTAWKEMAGAPCPQKAGVTLPEQPKIMGTVNGCVIIRKVNLFTDA